MSTQLRRLLVCTLFAVMLGGCSMVDTMKSLVGLGPARTPLRTLNVQADVDANSGNATQLDVVVGFDAEVAAALPKTGPEWFAQRDALERTLATRVEVVRLEVPAATAAFAVKLPSRIGKAISVSAFANYVAPKGQAAITLTPFGSARLRLTPDNIVVTPE